MSNLSLSDRAGFIGLGRFIRAISKLLFSVVIVRILTQYEYGSYRQIVLLYSIFSIIFFLGIPQSIYYWLPKTNDSNRKTLVLQSEILLFILGIFLGVIFFITSNTWANSFSNDQLSKLLKAFSIYPVFDFPIQVLPPILICIEKHKLSANVNVLFSTTYVLSLLIPLLLGFSLFEAFCSLLIVSAIQFVFVCVYLLKIFKEYHISFDKKLLISQLKYSIPLGISSILVIISRELDKLIISFFFTPDKYAIYSIGARELPLVSIIPYAVSSTLFPKYVSLLESKRYRRLLDLISSSIRKVGLIMIPIIPLFFILSKEIVNVLYTSDYLESIPVFKLYLILILFHITAFDSILLSMGLSKYIMQLTVIFVILNLLLNILFIKLFGFIGPAISTVIVTLIVTILYIQKIGNQLDISWKKIMPYSVIMKIILISLIALIPCVFIEFLNISDALKIIVVSVIYGTVYLMLLKKFEILLAEDIDLLKRWIRFDVFKH